MSYAFVIPRRVVFPGVSFPIPWGVCPSGGELRAAAHSIEIRIDGVRVFPLQSFTGPGGEPDSAMPGGVGRLAVSGVVNVDRPRVEAALREAAPPAFSIAEFYRTHSVHRVTLLARAGNSVLTATNTFQIASTGVQVQMSFIGPSLMVPSVSGDVRGAIWKEDTLFVLQMRNTGAVAANLSLLLFEAKNTIETIRGTFGRVTNMLEEPFTAIRSVDVALAPGEMRDVALGLPVLKDWPWLLQGAWVQIGPVLQGWTYEVRATGLDEFRSPVPEFTSPQIRVEYSVANSKIESMLSALRLITLAGVLYVASIAWPKAAALAELASSAAESFGHNALDPPSPDLEFKKKVLLSLPDIAGLIAGPGDANLARWIEAATHFALIREALYKVEAKVLGAIKAKNGKAEKARVDDYTDGLRKLAACYLKMSETAISAASELGEAGVTAQKLEELLPIAQGRALAGSASVLAQDDVKTSDAARLAEIVPMLSAKDLDLRRTILRTTLTVGKSLKALNEEVVRGYLEVRPSFLVNEPSKD